MNGLGLSDEVSTAIRRANQAITPLHTLNIHLHYQVLAYARYNHLVVKTNDDAALLAFHYVDYDAAELSLMYVKPECRGGTVVDEVFRTLFSVCDSKSISLVGVASRFEVLSEVDRQAIFTHVFWQKRDIDLNEDTGISVDSNERWLRRLLEYGWTQVNPSAKQTTDEYWQVRRDPQR